MFPGGCWKGFGFSSLWSLCSHVNTGRFCVPRWVLEGLSVLRSLAIVFPSQHQKFVFPGGCWRGFGFLVLVFPSGWQGSGTSLVFLLGWWVLSHPQFGVTSRVQLSPRRLGPESTSVWGDSSRLFSLGRLGSESFSLGMISPVHFLLGGWTLICTCLCHFFAAL